MSKLLARIMLAIFMLPIGAVLYFCLFVVFDRFVSRNFGYNYRSSMSMVFGLTGAITWLAVGYYWYFLWRASVRWTRQRLIRTAISVGVCMAIGLVFTAAIEAIESQVGWFIGTVIAPICWLISTTFLWQETIAERVSRDSRTSPFAVNCPKCTYNMKGLRSTQCPECGTTFTLDELLASQPQLNSTLE